MSSSKDGHLPPFPPSPPFSPLPPLPPFPFLPPLPFPFPPLPLGFLALPSAISSSPEHSAIAASSLAPMSVPATQIAPSISGSAHMALSSPSPISSEENSSEDPLKKW